MKLIFVFNSDGTILSLVRDTVHKIASPDTYACNLCRMTYPVVTMQGDWRKFIQALPHEVVFLHRDKFHEQYPDRRDTKLPAVFTEGSSGVSLLIPHTEINQARSIRALIKTVQRALSKPA